MLTLTEPPNHTTTCTHDTRANWLTGIDLQNNASIDISFVYDAASRRTSMTDGTGTTTYTYDNADRRLSQAAPVTGTVSYGYDAAGRLSTLTYPSTHAVTYGYDAHSRLSSVRDWANRTTAYTYDAGQRLTATTDPNGVTTTRTYDNADRLLSITHAGGSGTLEAPSYTYDAAGNRVTLVDSSGTTSYTYDALNRLTAVGYPNGDTAGYGYDLVGNRTSQTTNGVTKTNAFDAANRGNPHQSGWMARNARHSTSAGRRCRRRVTAGSAKRSGCSRSCRTGTRPQGRTPTGAHNGAHPRPK